MRSASVAAAERATFVPPAGHWRQSPAVAGATQASQGDVNICADIRPSDRPAEEWLTVVAMIADELTRVAPADYARLRERLEGMIGYDDADRFDPDPAPETRNILLTQLIERLDRRCQPTARQLSSENT